MKMSIKELAKLANVSVTTVSLVLNDKPSRISETKKKEIKELAKLHDYQPNFSARNLVTKTSKTIGLLMPDIENLFFSALAKNVEDELRQNGYSLLLVNSDDMYKNDISLIKNLVNRGVDGLLLTIANDAIKHKAQYETLLEDIKTPYVMVDRTLGNPKHPQVYFDNQLGGYLATKYLIDQGHQKIACLISKDKSLNGYYRYKGYQKALKMAHIDLNEQWVFDGDYRFQSGYHMADRLVSQQCDALFAGNDLMAYGAIKRLKELGKKVPEDIEVVGYDNLEFSKMLGLNLPSVEQNVKALGKQSVALLMDLMKNQAINRTIVLEPTFKKD